MIVDELVAVLGYDVRGQAALRRFNQGLDNTHRRAVSMEGAMRGLAVGAAGLFGGYKAGQVLKTGAAQAIIFEDGWARANKTLGLSQGELANVQEAAARLTADMAVPRLNLVELLAEAGRQGIQGEENLVELARVVTMAAEAFDIGAAQTAQYFGEIAEQSQKTVPELEILADKINWLGNNTAAQEATIIQYASRIFSLAKDAGIAEDTLLALWTAMIASGREANVAATSLRALQREAMAGSLDATKRQIDGFSQAIAQSNLAEELLDPNNRANMDALAERFTHDFQGTLLAIVEGVSNLPQHEQNSVVEAMFGEEARRGFGSLLADVDRLRAALARIQRFNAESSGGLRTEYESLTDTVVARWQRLTNVVGEIARAAGTPALATLNEQLERLITNLEGFRTGESETGAAWDDMVEALREAEVAAAGLWGQIKELKDNAAEALDLPEVNISLGPIFDPMVEALIGRVQQIGERFAEFIERPIGSAIDTLGETITNAINAMTTALEGVSAVLNTISSAVAFLTNGPENAALTIGESLRGLNPEGGLQQIYNQALQDILREQVNPGAPVSLTPSVSLPAGDVDGPVPMPGASVPSVPGGVVGNLDGAALRLTDGAQSWKDAAMAMEAAMHGVAGNVSNASANAERMDGDNAVEQVVNDNRVDSRDQSVEVNAPMSVTINEAQAPQATAGLIKGAVDRAATAAASRIEQEPAAP